MCGVIGIIGTAKASQEVFLGLQNLQHRGQDAAGIHTNDGHKNYSKKSGLKKDSLKNVHLVQDVFSKEDMAGLKGSVALGHVRYPTVGASDSVQPFYTNSCGGISLAHNGNVVNFESVERYSIGSLHKAIPEDCDSQLILNVLASELEKKLNPHQFLLPDMFFDSLTSVYDKVIGGFAIVGYFWGKGLFAFKDPNGIKPLILGEKEVDGKRCYAIASEIVALKSLDYNNLQNIKHGEAIFIDNDMNVHRKFIKQGKEAACEFEATYFSRIESTFQDQWIFDIRKKLGKELALTINDKNFDVIIPIPDSAMVAAIEMSKVLDVPFEMGLIKNRYSGKTFIMPSIEKRELALELKLTPIRQVIEGKKILLVEDSLVRGTTMRKVVKLIRSYRPTEIHLAVYSPPRRFPCFYGIDFPLKEELIAKDNKPIDVIAKELDLDGLYYQPVENMSKTLGNGICSACMTGEYPTDISEAVEFAQRRKLERLA